MSTESTDDFHTYGYRPDADEVEKNNRGWSWTSDGRRQDWGTGEYL